MKNDFYFILKAFFVLKIFKFLSWLFGDVGKTTWLETLQKSWRQKSWRQNMVNEQLQCTYCPISHEVKTTIDDETSNVMQKMS